ncbi:transposase [Streptomyces viridosporus]|uniref:transposase n=1 Tax=Streptomyces viridosporus TaxID=67581 RepID=UPI0036FBB934
MCRGAWWRHTPSGPGSYLPKSWTADLDRCRAAKIPDGRDFVIKGDLVKAMVQRALASFLPIAWVTADSAYGQEWRLRRTLHEDEEAGVGHVLAVRSSSPFLHRAGSISSSPRRLRKPGNVTPAAERRRGRASMSGPRRSCRPSPTSTVTSHARPVGPGPPQPRPTGEIAYCLEVS